MMGNTAQGSDTERSIQARRLDDSIVTRFKAEAEAVTALWRPGTADDIVFYAVNRSASLVVLLLKSLASFIMATQSSSWDEAVYEKIQRHYTTTSKLVDIWGSAFGTFTSSTKLSFERAGLDLRRPVNFCSNDGDVACVQLRKVSRQLECELSNTVSAQPSVQQVVRGKSNDSQAPCKYLSLHRPTRVWPVRAWKGRVRSRLMFQISPPTR